MTQKLKNGQYKPKVGIIGLGFVGNAIQSACDSLSITTVIIDTNPSKAFGTYNEIKSCDGVFVCVPSPMAEDGQCDSSILEDVLLKLSDYTGVIISKVTAPPNVYIMLSEKYENLVYCPEFLTAANAVEDYANTLWTIIGGGNAEYRKEAARIIKSTQPHIDHVCSCKIEEASYTKYAINSFLAVKVVFMNELYALINASGTAKISYDFVATMFSMDTRTGGTHTLVPGEDNRFGFGGACLPKDTIALLKVANDANIDMSVLGAAVNKNLFLRLLSPYKPTS